MRILAVDYGDARTGFALSDATGTLTGEAWVLTEWNAQRVAAAVAEAAEKKAAARIVLGYPRNMDGSAGPRAQKSAALAEEIRGLTDVPVVLWDERLTTVDAHRILTETGRHGKKRKNTVDAVAASLILESYLRYLAAGGESAEKL